MSAFFSGTDDANENMTQFYGVWGKVNQKNPQFVFRWVCGDEKVKCDPDILIDWPKATIETRTQTVEQSRLTIEDTDNLIDLEQHQYDKAPEPTVVSQVETELLYGPFKRVEYPDDWLGQHTKNVSYTTTYGQNMVGKTPGKQKKYPSGQGTLTGSQAYLDDNWDEWEGLDGTIGQAYGWHNYPEENYLGNPYDATGYVPPIAETGVPDSIPFNPVLELKDDRKKVK